MEYSQKTKENKCDVQEKLALKRVVLASNRFDTLKKLTAFLGCMGVENNSIHHYQSTYDWVRFTQRQQSKQSYDPKSHIMTTIALCYHETFNYGLTNTEWKRMQVAALKAAYLKSREYQIEGFVMFVEKFNALTNSYEIVARCKVKPYFLQVLSPVLAVHSFNAGQIAKEFACEDMAFCDLFNNHYSKKKRKELKQGNSLCLNAQNYDKKSVNYRALLKKTVHGEKSTEPVFAQMSTGSFTQSNSYKLKRNVMNETSVVSTKDVLEFENIFSPSNSAGPPLFGERFYDQRLCMLSWWGNGHNPDSNQILFQHVKEGVYDFWKIDALNDDKSDALLCYAANASKLLEYYKTVEQHETCFQLSSEHENNYDEQLNNHYERILSLQFLFLYLFVSQDISRLIVCGFVFMMATHDCCVFD